jgi:catechol 2,3-dioxygenase-like lactoylglutathione lyase family enzyme
VLIHHVSVGTNDIKRSKRFYDAVLPIVGLVPMAEDEGGLGYGSGTFHFSVQVPIDGKPATVGNGSHVAFAVEDRSVVNRFTRQRWNMAAATMALRGCGRITMPTIMGRSSAIRTVTRSRQ